MLLGARGPVGAAESRPGESDGRPGHHDERHHDEGQDGQPAEQLGRGHGRPTSCAGHWWGRRNAGHPRGSYRGGPPRPPSPRRDRAFDVVLGPRPGPRRRLAPVVAPATALTLARGTRGRVAAYVALTKPRIVELLLVTTLPTMIVAQRGLPSIGLIVATLAGGSLAAGGANAINMFVDRDIDQLMHRTRNRPLVTGAVTPSAALVFACLLEVAAFGELWRFVNLLSAVLAVSATAFYVFVYTLWLKRRSAQNIVIGGAAGAVPVLVGWAAVTGRLSWAPVVLFAIIFLWTPPHFWALAVRYRDDYKAADVPMQPVVASM